MPSVNDVCWCQCVPRVKVWEDNNATALADVQLLDRKADAERSENWAPAYVNDPESSVYWHHDDGNGWLFEWFPTHQTYERFYLSLIDADHHVAGRHEFERVEFEPESGGADARFFRGTVAQGVDADEFVITFDDWCRAIPMVLTIANDTDTDPSVVAATITQTSAHVWTFTRATRIAADFRTQLTINETEIEISSTTDDLASVEAKILERSLDLNYETCSIGRYEVYRHKEQFGESTIADPSLLFIELRLAAVQPEVITRPGQSIITPDFQIEVLQEPGWYVYGLHESIANTAGFVVDDKDATNWTGAQLAPVDVDYEPANHVHAVPCRWVVSFREGQWSLSCRLGSDNGNNNETLFEPVTSEDVGLRPGQITFEGVRPYCASIEPDGTATPGDPQGLTIDPIGKQVVLHIHGHEQFAGNGEDFPKFVSRTTEFTVDGTSFDGTYGNGTPPVDQGIGYGTTYPATDYRIEWAMAGKSTDDETPDKIVRCQVYILGGGFETVETTPVTRRDFTRGVEMLITVTNTITATVEYQEQFLPDDGRVVLDDVYDNPITWVRKDAGGAETVVTGRGWSQPGECPNYEDFEFESPAVQRVTWKNETFYLRRIEDRRWSRIVTTADGEELMLLLEFKQFSNQYPFGWELSVCDASDIGLPFRSIFRFIDGGWQHDPQHDERPAFSAWRPDATNRLVLIWHRDNTDRLPASVTVEPVASVNPRGTSTWQWSQSADDWVMTSDDSADDHEPFKPTNRGVADTDTKTTASVRGYDVEGNPSTDFETWYWSPDGVAWVLLMDSVLPNLTHPDTPTRGPAPTDPPASEGDVCRVLATYPV